MTQQHVLQVNNLVYSQDTWDQAQPVILEFRGNMLGLIRSFVKDVIRRDQMKLSRDHDVIRSD